MTLDKCNVCTGEFSLKDEGGIKGDFGILPVAFCPACLCCMQDMCDQLSEFDEEIEG